MLTLKNSCLVFHKAFASTTILPKRPHQHPPPPTRPLKMCNPPSKRPSLSNIPTLKTKQHLVQPLPPQDSVITKTHPKLTTHNIQKRKDTTNALISQHFQTYTEILCLQEALEKPTLPPNPGLTTFYSGATTNSNGTVILVPSYITPFTKLMSHTHSEGTITAIQIPLPGYPIFALVCLYKTYHASLRH